MRRAIGKYSRDFIAIILLFVVALGVGGYILSNQRLYLPKWVPIVGSDFVDRKLELQTAQSITPGQGQEVTIAGVKVGEVAKVNLVNGRAVVTMKLRRSHSTIYRNASALLRPKTGLNDMLIELDPGTPKAGKADAKWVIPVDQTLPNVNADEILAALDGDTRSYLQLLVAGAGQGLKGNARNLSNTFRRFEPTAIAVQEITQELAKRRTNIARSIHNFRLLVGALGEKDTQISKLVDTSNAVFQSFAREDQSIRQTLQALPTTLDKVNTNLPKADRLAVNLGTTLQALRPTARALGPALQQQRPFFKETTPIVKNKLRPFARDAQPTVKILRPAARNLAKLMPDLTSAFKTVNQLVNELAYNPPGDAEEGYLFYASWANHAGQSLFANQDAHGPIRHGLVLLSCSAATTLQSLIPANPTLGVLIQLLNPVTKSEVCPGQAGAGSGTTPAGTPGSSTTTGPGAGGGSTTTTTTPATGSALPTVTTPVGTIRGKK